MPKWRAEHDHRAPVFRERPALGAKQVQKSPAGHQKQHQRLRAYVVDPDGHTPSDSGMGFEREQR